MHEQLGPYRLLSRLGHGAMGVVYEARHEGMRRTVAIKLLESNLDGELARARFLREMRLAAQVSHPNVVRVFDGGNFENQPYIVMERLEGEPLSTRLAGDRRLAWPEVVRIVLDVARGLAAIHERAIVHRDLKPANIFLCAGGDARILDFGIANADSATRLTEQGGLIGTLVYMAPELFRGEPATPASDLWSLGCTLYQLLTGRTPYVADSLAMMMKTVREEPPPDIRQFNREIPNSLRDILRELLDRDPATRLASAGLLAERLEALLISPQIRRWPAAMFGLGTALVLALLVNFYPTRPIVQPSPRSTPTAREITPPRSNAPLPFDAWRRIEPLIPRMHQVRMDATAHAELMRHSPIDLGRDWAMWIHWVHLGRWLAAADRPAQPPRSRLAAKGSVHFNDSTLVEHARGIIVDPSFTGTDDEAPLQRLVFAIHGTARLPDDVRTWLILARGFDRVNRLDEARLLYGVGLSLRGSSQLEGSPFLIGFALARALMVVPGHELDRDWAQFFLGQACDEQLLYGLQAATHQTDPSGGLFQRTLENLVRVPAPSPDSYWSLACSYHASGKLNEALHYWRQLFSRFPESKHNWMGNDDSIFNIAVITGDLSLARAIAERRGLAPWRALWLQYCEPQSGLPSAQERDRILERFPRLLPMEVAHCLEVNQVDRALTAFRRIAQPFRPLSSNYWLFYSALDLIGAGCADPSVERYAHNVFSTAWTFVGPRQYIVGALGPAAQERFFARSRIRQRVASNWRAMDAALGRSRHGDPIGALDVVRGLNPAIQPDDRYCEILGRAFWWRLLHLAAAGPLPRSNARVVSTKTFGHRYLEALARSDTVATVTLSEKVQPQDVSAPLAYLTLAWNTALHGSRASYQEKRRGLAARIRAQQLGLWLLKELESLEKAVYDRQ